MSHPRLKNGRGRCPVTGDAHNFSYLGNPHDPDFVIVYGNVSTSYPGWIHTGCTKDRNAEMFKPERLAGDDDDRNPRYQALPLYTAPLRDPKLAAPHILHQVYTMLLRLCPLSATHTADLAARDLHDKDLDALRDTICFGSMPRPNLRPQLAQEILKHTGYSLAQLLGVPGFFLNASGRLSIGGSQGMLIPCYDAKKRIVACQIRVKGGGYRWLSSASKEGGVGSGAPSNVLGSRDAESLWITEGVFKAIAILRHGLNEAVIAMPGVGNLRSVLQGVEAFPKATKVVLAFDADYLTNAKVLQSLVRLMDALVDRGLAVTVKGWAPEHGKGIDDALQAGLAPEQLLEIPQQGLRRAATRPSFKQNPRLDTTAMPRFDIEAHHRDLAQRPTEAALREETCAAVLQALQGPTGRFTSLANATGSGKSHALSLHAPTWTLLVLNNYTVLEEAEAKLRRIHGDEHVVVLYGRQAAPTIRSDGSIDARQAARFAQAGCTDFAAMRERSARGHDACAGCPMQWKADKDPTQICAYWKQRKAIIHDPPPYLLCVPQTLTSNPELQRLLPDPESAQAPLFGHYTTIVFDDVPGLDSHLANETTIHIQDVEQWLAHPALSGLTPEVALSPDNALLLAWCRTLHDYLSLRHTNAKSNVKSNVKSKATPDTTERLSSGPVLSRERQLWTKLEQLSKALPRLRVYACEKNAEEGLGHDLPHRYPDQPEGWGAETEGEGLLPLRRIALLQQAILSGQKFRLRYTESLSSFHFLTPSTSLWAALRQTRILHLDATPDEATLTWLASLLQMDYEAPAVTRVSPPIFQLPQRLWTREQLQQQDHFVQALATHQKETGGLVFGFKSLSEQQELPLDGHWGCHERGLNAFAGASSIALLGHYALPEQEVAAIAWRRRTLTALISPDAQRAHHLQLLEGRPSPEEQELRSYHDLWRPWSRTMHAASDPLFRRIQRHQHTASVIQAANRTRDRQAPVYLLSGEPLDGLSWDIPVQLVTQEELAAQLSLDLKQDMAKVRTLPSALQSRNAKRRAEAEARYLQWETLAQSLVVAVAALEGRLPNTTELQRYFEHHQTSTLPVPSATQLQTLRQRLTLPSAIKTPKDGASKATSLCRMLKNKVVEKEKILDPEIETGLIDDSNLHTGPFRGHHFDRDHVLMSSNDCVVELPPEEKPVVEKTITAPHIQEEHKAPKTSNKQGAEVVVGVIESPIVHYSLIESKEGPQCPRVDSTKNEAVEKGQAVFEKASKEREAGKAKRKCQVREEATTLTLETIAVGLAVRTPDESAHRDQDPNLKHRVSDEAQDTEPTHRRLPLYESPTDGEKPNAIGEVEGCTGSPEQVDDDREVGCIARSSDAKSSMEVFPRSVRGAAEHWEKPCVHDVRCDEEQQADPTDALKDVVEITEETKLAEIGARILGDRQTVEGMKEQRQIDEKCLENQVTPRCRGVSQRRHLGVVGCRTLPRIKCEVEMEEQKGADRDDPGETV